MTDAYTHRIEIFTASLHLVGDYDMPVYRRVSDAFNGEQRRYIPLRNGSIAPLQHTQQAQQVPLLLLDRTEALLIASIVEAPPPGDYARQEQIRGVVPITAMFFTETFVVRGTFHRRPNHTLIEAFERFDEDFLPLNNVQVYALNSAFHPIAREFAALARSRIVALYHLPDGNHTEPAGADPQPSADTDTE
ncbi:MAG TPA: hypothetical protein PKA05_10310 [Roseiflexaceae bacterium]|nr:hypothetical protein [Roseiflexaceae bacterium]HMP40761.1 hypothetical protein [Roseiflexaceae bacterium]